MEIIIIEAIDNMQLKRKIFILRSEESTFISRFSKHLVILFPPRNWSEPSSPPLCISCPDMPTLKKKSEPSVFDKDDCVNTRLKIIPNTGMSKLSATLRLSLKLSVGR